jgi:hypothetical protein
MAARQPFAYYNINLEGDILKIDRYTKLVLTVIAGCLLALVVQNAIRPSQAEYGEVQKVQICDGLGAGPLHCAGLVPVVDSNRIGMGIWVVPSSIK